MQKNEKRVKGEWKRTHEGNRQGRRQLEGSEMGPRVEESGSGVRE